MTKIAGRQVEIGIGIETSAGTPVAATNYFKWDSFDMQSMSDKVMLESARGIRNKISNSLIIKKYGKGSIEFVPTVDMLPYMLGLAMGTRNTALRTGESAVYDHTFTIQNANASMKTATLLCAQGGIQTERYANVVVDNMEITIDTDLAKCKCDLIGNYPDTSSISSSYTQDTLFSRNQMTAVFGTSLANASGTNASTTITSTGVNVTDGDLLVVGAITYRYKNTMAQAYDIKIGADAATTLSNTKKAFNASGTPGTEYFAGTLIHPTMNATTLTATTLLLVANVAGTAANAIVTTTTAVTLSFPGGTVNSGTPGTSPTPTPLVNFSLSLANDVLFDDAFLSGSNQPIAGGFIAGPLSIKGSYTLHFADTVELAKYQANTNNAMIVTLTGASIGLAPSYEQIVIKLGKLILTKAPIEYQIDGLSMIKQEFDVQYDATDHEMSVVVTNAYAGTNYH